MNLADIKTALASIVAYGDSDLEQRRARLSTLCNLFLDRYGESAVSLLRAPARISLLGEHIDYVSYIPTASLTFGSRERDVLMLYRNSPQPQVRSASTSPTYKPSSFAFSGYAVPLFGQNVEADWLSFLFDHGTPAPHWQNYIKGAVSFARAKFGQQITNGFDCALDSNIPAGGGASSSSALVVLGGAAIREVNEIQFAPEELAQDSAMAEWYIGTRGGSMDHTTICLAQRASAVIINYSNRQTKRVALPDKPFEWITFFSKPADKGREVMIEYNERAAVSRLLIPAVINQWKVTSPQRHAAWSRAIRSFVDGPLSVFDTAKDLLSTFPDTISVDTLQLEYSETFSELEHSFPALLNEQTRWPLQLRTRALHHLGEVKRVALATRILDSIETGATPESQLSAMQAIGKLLDESHASLRDLYGVSTSDVEQLIDIINSDANVLGCRLMGGGFGGNVLALTTRDHSRALIEQVQQHYYSPQGRDGTREGSVMVSTPGDGLAHVDLNDMWQNSIEHVNSLGSSAAEYGANLRSLIDLSPVRADSTEIWPVIVAAGKGTRASTSGLNLPKPVALIRNKPAIVHVLQNIRKGLGKTRPPVIIVSPETGPSIRQALHGEDVLFVVQHEALGTGDAVLQARALMRDFAGLALVVWSTQPVIREKTFERTAKLASLFNRYEMVVPTTFRQRPYAPIQRDVSGQVLSASETHLESAEHVNFGETNIGLFLLKNQTMFDVLLDLRNRFWNEARNRYDRSGGELGFPNEVINTLAQRTAGVFATPIADWREEQGIKQLEDLSKCEEFISKLEQEQASREQLR
jgi:galactokinase/CTP:molybdopterin cytidylyltransferase MocA